MNPGLLSNGGKLPSQEEQLKEGTPVAVMAQGKENAVGIGLLKMSTEEIKKSGKGIGVDNIHHIGGEST